MYIQVESLAKCVDIGHKFKIVSACPTRGRPLGNFECITCGYKKCQPLTASQQRACRKVGILD